MNKEIYNQLLTIAKEVFKYLKCTEKNRVLSASEIANNLQARADGVKNKNTWAVYWSDDANLNLPENYTVCAGSFKASFDFWAVFAYLAKFETLAGIPLKDRFSFAFGDGSERKEKVNAVYYDKKTRRAIAGTILLYLLNEKIAIKPDGTRARVFIGLSCRFGGVWWYEVNTLDHYKKNYESNKLYLTGDYYNNMINILRRWNPEINYIFNDICTRASEQIKENDTATAEAEKASATTGTSETRKEATAATGIDGGTTTATAETKQEATAATGIDGGTTAATGIDGGTAATGTTGGTAAATGIDGGTAATTATAEAEKASATTKTKHQPPPPPAMARGAPSYIYAPMEFFKNEAF